MTTPLDPAAHWQARYSAAHYVYGTEPNEFLRDVVAGLPPGDVLCLADGEGRNSVFLAERGHRVTAVDLSANGIEKARTLAAERNVTITTVVADLATYDLGVARWDLIVSIFAHTPPAVRQRVHQAVVAALRPGGRFILEAYTPAQIGRGTGGPATADMTMTLAGLTSELAGLTMTHGVELERDIVEGTNHTGIGAVVQVIAAR